MRLDLHATGALDVRNNSTALESYFEDLLEYSAAYEVRLLYVGGDYGEVY